MSGPSGSRDRVETERIVVNGLTLDVMVDGPLIDEVLLPPLERLAARTSGQRRTYVFLAAPPATGKSVLAGLVVRRARERHLDVDAVGIDGFHFPQRVLEQTLVPTTSGPVPLARVKGAPETFDTDELDRHLAWGRNDDVAWPVYDRTLHDVVPHAQPVTAGVVVVEGNWLLLDDPRWTPLLRHSSFNIFIDADRRLLRERLIDRKVLGGSTRADAVEFYERSDRRNVERVLAQSDRNRVDLLLHLTPDGSIEQGEAR